MQAYSIKDLENLTGVQAHTIRMWEQRYNLLTPSRTATNNRIYSDSDLRKLLFVTLLNNSGMKISRIAKLTDTEIADTALQLSESPDSAIENHIDNLKLIMFEMNEAKFEKLFGHLVLHIGLQKTVSNIFIPFFKRLTFLRQTTAVTEAQINFIMSLYRQKLYVAIDGLAPYTKTDSKKIIMFLPYMEFLDYELLFCYYIAKMHGFQTLYLGASLPYDNLSEFIEKNPECYLFSIAILAQTDLNEYYTSILKSCNENNKLLLTGSQTVTIKINDPRLTVFPEYTDFLSLITK